MPFHSAAGQLSSDSFCQYCNNVSFAEMGQKWSGIQAGISIFRRGGNHECREVFRFKTHFIAFDSVYSLVSDFSIR